MYILGIIAILYILYRIIKEALGRPVLAENWENKELMDFDRKQGMSEKDILDNISKGRYIYTIKYPEPHRETTQYKRIIIENSELYKLDIEQYGTYLVSKWSEQGRYNLNADELDIVSYLRENKNLEQHVANGKITSIQAIRLEEIERKLNIASWDCRHTESVQKWTQAYYANIGRYLGKESYFYNTKNSHEKMEKPWISRKECLAHSDSKGLILDEKKHNKIEERKRALEEKRHLRLEKEHKVAEEIKHRQLAEEHRAFEDEEYRRLEKERELEEQLHLEQERKLAEEIEFLRLEKDYKEIEDEEAIFLEKSRKEAEDIAFLAEKCIRNDIYRMILGQLSQLLLNRKSLEKTERLRLEAEQKAAEEAERLRLEEERRVAEDAKRMSLQIRQWSEDYVERQRLEEECKAAEDAERQHLEEEHRSAEDAKRFRLKEVSLKLDENYHEWLNINIHSSKVKEIEEKFFDISNILVEGKVLKLPLMETKKIASIENAIRQVEVYKKFEFIRDDALLILSSYLKFLKDECSYRRVTTDTIIKEKEEQKCQINQRDSFDNHNLKNIEESQYLTERSIVSKNSEQVLRQSATYGHLTSDELGKIDYFSKDPFKVFYINNRRSIKIDHFRNNSILRHIVVGEDTHTIGAMSFYGCKNLECVILPSGLKKIGANVFSRCSQLKHIFVLSKKVCWSSDSLFKSSKNSDLIIYGYRDSTTARYAYEKNFYFCDIESFFNSISIGADANSSYNDFVENESIDKLNIDVKSYAEQYGINPLYYENVNLQNLSFSARAQHCLKRGGIKTVSDLLHINQDQLLKIRGCGIGTVKEYESYLETMTQNVHECTLEDTYAQKYNLKPDLFMQFDVQDTTLPPRAKKCLKNANINKVSDLLCVNVEFLQKMRNCGACTIWEIENYLRNLELPKEQYVSKDFNERKRVLDRLVHDIPKIWRNSAAIGFVNAYTENESTREKLLKQYISAEDSLDNILNSNLSIQDGYYQLNQMFLKWCVFDLTSDIGNALDRIFQKSAHMKIILEKRSKDYTLQEVGDELGITRERVRQLEMKAKKSFAEWQSQYKLLLKISAIRNSDTVLTPAELEEYFEENTDLLLFLLKDKKGNTQYFYDSKLDVFVIGDDSLSNQTFKCLESLPNEIKLSDFQDLLEKNSEKYDITEEILQIAIMKEYRLSEDSYYRNRKTLGTIYTEILENYYPNGMHIYDDYELNRFRTLVKKDYGDVVLPQNDHALSSRIAEIGILCQRGTYKNKKDQYISKSLANKIYKHISNSDNDLLMIGTLFHEFEEELSQYGVDNKYYLQGILREIYGDRFIFRKDYISKDKSATTIQFEIANFIKKSKYPVGKNEIKQKFPGVSEITINSVISDDNIINLFGEYLYSKNLKFEQQDLDYLRNVLESFLRNNTPVHCHDIFDYVNNDQSNILTKNSIFLPYSFFSVLEYLFKKTYQFQRPYIAPKGILVVRSSERVEEYIHGADELDVNDLFDYAKECHYPINDRLAFIDSLNDSHFLINKDTIMRNSLLGLNSSICDTIEDLIVNEIKGTMLIKHLSCIPLFPTISVPWNEWLIYSIVKKWSKKLDVATTEGQFRTSSPVVAFKGDIDSQSLSRLKDYQQDSVIKYDDLDNIDDLIADYILDD